MGCISSSGNNPKAILLTSPGGRSSIPFEFNFKIKKTRDEQKRNKKLDTIIEAGVHLEWTESYK